MNKVKEKKSHQKEKKEKRCDDDLQLTSEGHNSWNSEN